MDTQTARAILSEVAAGGWAVDLPEDEKDLIKLAEEYVEGANKWVADGDPPDEHISAIINLAKGEQVSPPVLSEPADNTHNDGGPPGEIITNTKDYVTGEYIRVPPREIDYGDTFESGAGKELLDEVAKTYPRRSSGGYSESDLREQEDHTFRPQDLPVPKPNPETTYDMPTDLTEVGDKSLRRLYSAFNAYSGRARWMLAIAQSNLANATHLRDEAYRSTYLKEFKRSKLEGEKIAQGTLEELSKDTDEYREWDERINKHNKEITHWRALSEIYGKNVEILSREWTMRTEQYERER